MKDFSNYFIRNILVEKVNLTRATLKEAVAFREKLEKDIYHPKMNVIIDLSSCSFMDSSFLGAIVLSKKKIEALEGNLKIIEPLNFTQSIFQYTKTLRLFDSYSSLDEAVNSFDGEQCTFERFERI